MTISEKIKWRIHKYLPVIDEITLNLKLAIYFKGKTGIEIGGPTVLFTTALPVYKMVKRLDGCNFSNSTVWEGNIMEGNNFNYYQNEKGYQYICEASNLKDIEAGKYDFLLASHCLEHCANSLATIKEWLRVLKPGGYMLLILPDKQFTFDHNREITSFNHLLNDLEFNIDETDLSHLKEIIALHDLSMDIPAGDACNFKQRSMRNFENRCLHHHVFDFNLLVSICVYFKLAVKLKKWISPYHEVFIMQKSKNTKKEVVK